MDYKAIVTRAQTKFLRGFVDNPAGPPPDQWPSPVVLRRWLKRPGFCGAMNSILRAMRYQADFHLTAAAASGAHLLHGAVYGGDPIGTRKTIESLIHLLRMNHVRQRFAEPLPNPEPRDRELIQILRESHASITVEEALRCTDVLDQGKLPPGTPPVGRSAWQKTGHPFSDVWKNDKSNWDPTDPEEPEQAEEDE